MSKRDDDSSADLDVGMTTAERRRRRRRGALRVPSDNVPRGGGRAPTAPPVVAPVPEDPALAMSIAYSFSSEASEPVPRFDDIAEDAPRRMTDSGPVAAPDFSPIAPDAGLTAIDPPSMQIEQQDFEMKTREMAAVDLEALGLQGLEPRSDVRIPLDTNVEEIPSIIVDGGDQDMQTRRSQTVLDAPPDEPPVRDSEVEVDVGGLESDAPTVDGSPEPPRTTTLRSSAESSPGITLNEDDLSDEPTSIGAMPTPPEPAATSPGIPTPPVLPVAQAAATGRPRLKTVALSESDLEEVLEAARAASEPGAPTPAKGLVSTIPGMTPPPPAPVAAPAPVVDTRTQPLNVREVEIVRPSEGSGEISIDVDDSDSDRHLVRRPSMPPPPPVAAPASTSPPAPVVAPAPAATPPPPPIATKAEAPHPPPPPPSSRTHTPPTPPPPSKKVSTPPAAAVSVSSAGGKDKAPRGKPWFVDLFDEDYLRTLPFLTAQATQAEAEFVIEAMNLSPGAQLLDVGCGYGRHAMELAARGYHLVGLDLSTPLLVRGGEEAHRRGLTINFVRGDMRELDFDAQFDGAYCLFSTFGYFDDETNKKALSNIARALRPGGRVLIEILNRDYVIADLPTRVWWEGDGCVVLEEVELNYFSSRIQVNRSVVFDDGRQLEQEISIRAYALHEVGKLMHAAGFRVLEVSGGYQTRGRFFGNQSRHIIVLAERKDPSAT